MPRSPSSPTFSRGARRRAGPFTLTLLGRDLGEGARIDSTLPATFTPLGPEKGAMGGASFLVETTSDPAVGVYPIRVITPYGISNVQLFSIGSFPRIHRGRIARPAPFPNTNDTIEGAQPLPNGPLTLNGKLKGPERDVYRINAKAGEKRVIEVEARRCGSAIDPVMELQDASGKVLARSEDAALVGLDARIEFTFPREGYYYVVLHDARFSTQAANFYRLKIGSYPYPQEIFPLGGRRGESVQVSLGTQKITADLRNLAADVKQIYINLPDNPALPPALRRRRRARGVGTTDLLPSRLPPPSTAGLRRPVKWTATRLKGDAGRMAHLPHTGPRAGHVEADGRANGPGCQGREAGAGRRRAAGRRRRQRQPEPHRRRPGDRHPGARRTRGCSP